MGRCSLDSGWLDLLLFGAAQLGEVDLNGWDMAVKSQRIARTGVLGLQRALLRAVLGALVALAVGPVGIAMAAAPTVTEIAPESGTTAGGTSVTIKGSGFVTGATVTIGGVEATVMPVISETEITATTPAGSAGPAGVVVEDLNGISEGGPSITYFAPPTVT